MPEVQQDLRKWFFRNPSSSIGQRLVGPGSGYKKKVLKEVVKRMEAAIVDVEEQVGSSLVS